MVTKTYNQLKLDNQMLDLEEFLTELSDEMEDSDYLQYTETLGLEMNALATRYVEAYNDPDNSYMRSLKTLLLGGKILSDRQCRAALNIWWRHLHGKVNGGEVRDERQLQCFTCKEWFTGMEALLKHKEMLHSGSPHQRHQPGCLDHRHPASQPCELVAPVTEQPVIEIQDSKLLLDLSDLPDGRYAVPDLSGKNDYTFLMVKRVHRNHWRDRRFVYGKIITGGEMVQAGTIEVKVWSSDSKELIGQQVPGALYAGKYEIELQAILQSPAPWAKLFGSMIGRCGICGKTLTDDISRSDGFGPECVKKINEGYWSKPPKDYTHVDDHGIPWCEKHKCYHHLQYGCK